MIGTLCYFETSILARATLRNIPEDDILQLEHNFLGQAVSEQTLLFSTKLLRQQADVIQNHVNASICNVG
jgi:hypothetical protein